MEHLVSRAQMQDMFYGFQNSMSMQVQLQGNRVTEAITSAQLQQQLDMLPLDSSVVWAKKLHKQASSEENEWG